MRTRRLLRDCRCWIAAGTAISVVLPVCSSFRTPALSEELGCSPTLTVFFSPPPSDKRKKKPLFYFDPLGLARDDNFSRFREAELKHCRVAMLAISETVLVPLCKKTTDWIPASFPESITATVQSLSTMDYLKVLGTCGILEILVFVQRDPLAMPGDYSVGYFGVQNKGAHEAELCMELENGRLAMIAIAGQVAAELVTGGISWEDQWILLFKQWAQTL